MNLNLHVLFAIFKRDFASYFTRPNGYVFICLFVLLAAFAAFWPDDFFTANLCNLDQLNRWLPFIMLIFIPTITMGIWSDERQEGTDELLLTSPARDLDVVLGKYLAAVAIYTVALLFSIVNVYMLYWLGSPDAGLLFANYVGYWLVGVAMLAVGMVASFLTSNLTVAFILGVVFNAPLVFSAFSESLAGLVGLAANRMGRTSSTGVWLEQFGRTLSEFSVAGQFADFGRGLITFPNTVFFLSVAGVMLYISLVLIGRRHWSSGRDNQAMGGHYLVRVVALLLGVAGLNLLMPRFEARRVDCTFEQLTTLSPKTYELINSLQADDSPVNIQAYISPVVPERYVQTRLNLIAMINELKTIGGDKIKVQINRADEFDLKAAEAEEQFGITPQSVEAVNKGNRKTSEIYLGVAVSKGLSKTVIPFVDRGVPVEYELVRSIVTVNEQKKRKLGVVTTDARILPGMDFQTFRRTPGERFLEELGKQYEVAQVDAANPIDLFYKDVVLEGFDPAKQAAVVEAVRKGAGVDEAQAQKLVAGAPKEVKADLSGENAARLQADLEKAGAKVRVKDGKPVYDVLMVVQPSKMGPVQLDNLMLAMKQGVPTAVFEDPYPIFRMAAPTSQPRQQPQTPFGMGGPPPEQCDINKLWTLLGVEFAGKEPPLGSPPPRRPEDRDQFMGRSVVWQQYNPFPNLSHFSPLFVFVGPEKDDWRPFPTNLPMTASLQTLMFPFPGEIKKASSKNKLTPLVTTKRESHGLLGMSKLENEEQMMQAMLGRATAGWRKTPEPSVLAWHIEGRAPSADASMADEAADGKAADAKTPDAKAGEAKSDKAKRLMNVILVADVDFVAQPFFQIRDHGEDDKWVYSYLKVDNITFLLNMIDTLAGEDRFIEIRNRRRQHRTLEQVDKQVNAIETEIVDVQLAQQEAVFKVRDEGQKRLKKVFEEFQGRVTELTADNPQLRAILESVKASQDEESMRDLLGQLFSGDPKLRQLQQEFNRIEQAEREKLSVAVAKATIDGNRQVKLKERQAGRDIRQLQDSYKLAAVIAPPILPLALAIAVFFIRRASEREGVSRRRLR